MDIASLVSVWSKNSAQPLDTTGFQILKYQKGMFFCDKAELFICKPQCWFAGSVLQLAPESQWGMLPAEGGLWKEHGTAPWDPRCPSCPAACVPPCCSPVTLQRAWPFFQRKWPWATGFTAEEKVDAQSNLIRGGTRCPHCIPCRKCTPACVQQRVGCGSCHVSKCNMWIHCNRRQKSLLVEIVQLKSGVKEKATQNCIQTSKHISNPHLEGSSWNTQSVWHEDSKRFLGQCGPTLDFCQLTAQAYFPVFGVRSWGVPARWMAPLPVLEQRWKFRDRTETWLHHRRYLPLIRSGSWD